MNEDEKRKFDALETLRKGAWDSFDKRRPFEWKLCFSLWAAFAAFLGTVLRGEPSFKSTTVAIGVTSAAIIIGALHLYWVIGLGKANNSDRNISFFFRGKMMELLSVSFPSKIIKDTSVKEKFMGKWFGWNHLFQIGITVLLSFGAIAAIWSIQ